MDYPQMPQIHAAERTASEPCLADPDHNRARTGIMHGATVAVCEHRDHFSARTNRRLSNQDFSTAATCFQFAEDNRPQEPDR
jgi:hypothetical protein